MAKKHNEFDSIKKDLDTMKIEQEKDKKLRESFEETKKKRAEQIKNEMKTIQENEDKIKKGLPGVG